MVDPNILDKAVEDLAYFAKRFSGLIVLKDELSDFASIQRQVDELKALKAKLGEDVSIAVDKVQVAQDKVKAIETGIKARLDEVEIEAKTVIAAAQVKGYGLLDQAKKRVDEVEAEAQKRKADIEDQIKAVTTHLKDTQDQVSVWVGKLAGLKSEWEAFKKKF